MGKIVLVLLAIIVIAGMAQATTDFVVKDGKAVITEVLTNQPVQMMGQNNQAVNIPGTTRDITTKIEVTKEQAQMQVIQLNMQRAQTVANFNKQIVNIDAQIKLLKDVDMALPEIKAEEPVQ